MQYHRPSLLQNLTLSQRKREGRQRRRSLRFRHCGRAAHGSPASTSQTSPSYMVVGSGGTRVSGHRNGGQQP
ncbi:hypothetical protein HanRHA438_Chr08g0333321 [Helianthus annuus]|nr:hypothetical protein HanIR_Chr08g0347941 [Helianthus annuus]KAJ0896308.1 hypothetical protein HanRHA438_Chr08g0333321 [Helianthus annuus]